MSIFAVMLGCGGPEKELPKNIASATERDKDIEVAAPVPAVSQPEARKRIDRCIAAATGGHPERLEKAKVNKQAARGRYELPNREVTNATREIQCSWPDRARISCEFSSDTIKKAIFVVRRPQAHFWLADAGGLKEMPLQNAKEDADRIYYEAIAEHWLPMLVPLADPRTVVFDLKKEPFGTKPADTVKVAIPDCPVYTVWFDENAELPGLITYSHIELGSRVQKHVVLSAPKSFGGILLPTQLESRRNGVIVQEWTVLQWEFPEKIDNAVFDQMEK